MRIVSIIILFLTFTTAHAANAVVDLEVEQHIETARKSLSIAITNSSKLIRSKLTSAQQRTFDEIEFWATSSRFVMQMLAGKTENNKRVILFSAAAYDLVSRIVDAHIFEQVLNTPGTARKWVDYAAEQMNRNMIEERTNKPLSPILAYPVLFKMPDHVLDKIKSDPGIRSLKNEMLFYSVGYVLAHEIGHHVLGHLDSPRIHGKAQEDEADEFAARVGTLAGFNPFVAGAPYVFFKAMGVKAGLISEIHSSPECRAARYAAIGGKAGLEDTAYIKFLRERNLTNLWNSSLTDAQRRLQLHC